MKIDYLVKMANQIAAGFAATPDEAAASREVAGHLRRFWAPQMRRQLVEHVDSRRGEGLSELVIRAVGDLR
ncbi:MAG: hypothetical protein HKUEN07_20830 [Rhodocyclaceae bacterium]|nr:MAG: hypothetical protein HKUEN07_20830 [Rhodocyclaceae bacterium]